MESNFHEPINLGNPDEVTIVQIAKEVRDAVPGTRSQIVHLPQPEVYKDDPKVRCPDITRAKQILGWSPTVSRREGLPKMIEYYREMLQK
jgi:nucleoside-diphosphate-sugar epimerase